jgi:biotin carboxyl carrier protein
MVEQFMLTVEDATYSIEIKGNQVLVNGYPLTIEWDEEVVKVNGVEHKVELMGDRALVDGIAYDFEVEWPADELEALSSGKAAEVTVAEGAVRAIMPGKIIRINVNEGDAVQKGQVVAILEAMKMENELSAPIAGVVKQIFTPVGATVEKDQPILEIE